MDERNVKFIIMINLKYIIESCLPYWPKIQLSKKDINLINNKCIDIVNVKKSETHHINDSKQIDERFTIGKWAEVALQRFLEIDFIDLSVGTSKDNSIPDLRLIGLDIGIKTSNYIKNNSAVILRDKNEPQVITLYLENRVFAICGYADIEILKKYRSDSLIKNKDMLIRKTGFYGYDKLTMFNNFRELQNLAMDYIIYKDK